MQGNSDKISQEDEKKKKIRHRYRQGFQGNVTLIPAKQMADLYQDNTPKKVGIYARVSTDNVNQTSSYELQKNFYENLVQRNPSWTLYKIYADEGISGTSLNHREAFKQMIEDCHAGKLDLIITKTVPRFARNVENCIHYSRELKHLKPPVGILFETEGIYTLREDSEMQLAFLATLAQEESHNKSMSMNRSIEMRFEMGLYLTPILLGYDHNEDGDLIINEEEADTVRLIFYMYICGYRYAEISEWLERYKRTTKIGNTSWSSGSLYQILRNERYCGDVLAHKTFTPDYLDHKSVKNINDRPQYYAEDHHEAIISREDFVTVQNMIDQSKYGFRNAVPELKVIDGGVLKGFVQINPKWNGFSKEDYLCACHSVLSDKDYLNPVITIKKDKGDFNLESYQVARSQYVPTTVKISTSMSIKHIKFSSNAIRELAGTMYVELLYHPIYQLLVVRKSDKNNRHAVKWCEYTGERFRPRKINGNAFMPVLYQLCEWNDEHRYTLNGYVKKQGEQKVLMFYVDEPEIRIRKENVCYTAYPKRWGKSIGDKYLIHEAKSISIFAPDSVWELDRDGVLANTPTYHQMREQKLKEEINEITKRFEEQIKEWKKNGESIS